MPRMKCVSNPYCFIFMNTFPKISPSTSLRSRSISVRPSAFAVSSTLFRNLLWCTSMNIVCRKPQSSCAKQQIILRTSAFPVGFVIRVILESSFDNNTVFRRRNIESRASFNTPKCKKQCVEKSVRKANEIWNPKEASKSRLLLYGVFTIYSCVCRDFFRFPPEGTRHVPQSPVLLL